MLHDNYLSLVESNQQQIKKLEAKVKRKTRKQGQLLGEFGFVLCIALSSLFRDRKIKIKKSDVAVLENFKDMNLLSK